MTLGTAGRAVGSVVGTAGSGIASASSSPQVQDVIDQALEGLNLKSEPKVVIEGVVVRLLQGDTARARDFLARQSGMSPAEAEARINAIREQLSETLAEVGDQTARTLSTAAWIFFGLMAFGALCAMFGGRLGARANFRYPITEDEFSPIYREERTAS